MRPRQRLVDLFSMFLQFDGDRDQNWAVDGRLKRSMERCLHQMTAAEASESFWALYWHKVWGAETASLTELAKGHLTAYVQEPCYWVAQKTAAGFTSAQFTAADCFQMAIAQMDKILKGFDAQQGFSFKSYASATLNSLIREGLRQRQEVDICTDWALLRKLSQKRLVEALRAAGLTEETIAQYVLVWMGFKLLYVPQQASATRKLMKPEPETWEAIAQYYNAERLPQSGTKATPERVEKWLLVCAKAGRAYLYPTLMSINTPKPGQESGEFLDDLSEMARTESLLTELIAEEEAETRQQWRSQLDQVLTEAIHRLEPPLQRLIELYYTGHLTQQQIAERLEMKQYTISRRLTKAREVLLRALVLWGQKTLHIEPTSNVLKSTSTALEEWLWERYRHDGEGQ